MRWLLTIPMVLCLGGLAACPQKSADGPSQGGRMPAGVQAYAGLRWVPADASYVVTARSAADLVAVGKDLADVAGIVLGVDAADFGAMSREELGYDMLSLDSLESIGIDTEGGVAVYSMGVSPTVVARLADPDKLQTFLDSMRERGASLQSEIADGLEVWSVHFDREVTISWTVIDGWLLTHASISVEREEDLAWLKKSRAAAGGFAGHADFTAALDAARVHAPSVGTADGPPLLGVIRPGPVLDAYISFFSGDDANEVDACLAPLRTTTRALIAAGSGTGGAQGSIVVDHAGGLAGLIRAAPAGWYGFRDPAPLQLDLGLDLKASVESMPRCPMPARELLQFGVRTAHVAAVSFDDGLPTRAAGYGDLFTDKGLRGLINDIPYVDRFSSQRKIGDVEVTDVKVPLIGIKGTYLLTKDRAIAAVGDGVVEQILNGEGTVAAGEVGHVSIRPHDISDDAWHLILEHVLEVDSEQRRAETIRRMRRWDTADIDAIVTGDQLVITASGTRHH